MISDFRFIDSMLRVAYYLGLSACSEWILSFVQEMGVRADLQRSWFHPINLFLSFLICEAKTVSSSKLLETETCYGLKLLTAVCLLQI